MGKTVIAFYLPQFHPIPENDKWWGAGFTEWTNVASSRPRFSGHRQPHLPADLGFYDLRVPEVRIAQASLASRYGVSGFCYYHYWFHGKRLLNLPLDEVLATGRPKFPFCLCWANESWTRAWDGRERDLLIEQTYSQEDHERHISWLLDVFRDTRYIRINGMPLFVIYRPENIPDLANMLKLWNERATASGIGTLYFVGVRSLFSKVSEEDLIAAGCRALLDFQPNSRYFFSSSRGMSRTYEILQKILPSQLYQLAKRKGAGTKVIDYESLVATLLARPWPKTYVQFPCVFPNWDNSARRRTSIVIQNDEPRSYERWLKHSIAAVSKYKPGEQIVFINAWNEWAEGCHLEPDLTTGHQFLEATKAALVQPDD